MGKTKRKKPLALATRSTFVISANFKLIVATACTRLQFPGYWICRHIQMLPMRTLRDSEDESISVGVAPYPLCQSRINWQRAAAILTTIIFVSETVSYGVLQSEQPVRPFYTITSIVRFAFLVCAPSHRRTKR